MTKATTITKLPQTQTLPAIAYQVAMPCPQSHLFEVTLTVTNWQDSFLNLKMPVWTPGSYLVREYSRQVQNFAVQEKDSNTPLESQKISKNHWQITTENCTNIIINYQVFANELTVRTNHLDATHGYFNGAAMFLFVPGYEQQPLQVSILPPEDWQVTTTLPPVRGMVKTFEAENFDVLVDSPFEIGKQRIYDFEVLGKPHQLAIWGQGNVNPQQIIEDTKKIIEVEADLYGGLPYQRYLFLLHLAGSAYGGLEHKESCSLIYNRFGFRDSEKYNRFIQLVAHEFFHLWNVKRIRPKELENFDYEQENYTPSLWFCEGTTSYYDLLIPCWAGIYEPKIFLEALSKDITRLQTTPGRKVQSLSESSFDAWIKLYRRDANSDNNQISYYLKGEIVSLMLDLLIRAKHQNRRSLNDVMRLMWHRFGIEEVGFTPCQLKETIESVAEVNLDEFFQRYIDETQELPLDEYLEPFGLHLVAVTEDSLPHLGIKLDNRNGRAIIKFVEANSPAELAGIDTEDELLAINNVRVGTDNFNERLGDYQAGDTINISVFHDEQLQTCSVTLEEKQPSSYKLEIIDSPSPAQKELFEGWVKKKSEIRNQKSE